jgi:hypothetical protein
MAKSTFTPDEMFESLTGFDEIAISKHFDADVSVLRDRPFTFMRALVFIDQRRTGLSDPEAKEAALGLTLREVDDYFAEDQDEPNPEDPITPEGKGDSPPG